VLRTSGGSAPLIVNTFCNFLRQLKYPPGDVLAKHYVAKPGRSSFERYVTPERTTSLACCMRAAERRRCG
jgi:hypothetical protein